MDRCSAQFGAFQPKATEAIEHREDNWSRRRLLLDVGATDADDKATRHRSGGLVWTFPLRGLIERLRPSPFTVTPISAPW